MCGGSPLSELVYSQGEISRPRPQRLLRGIRFGPELGHLSTVDAVKHLLKVRGHHDQTFYSLLQLDQRCLNGLQENVIAVNLTWQEGKEEVMT